MPGGVLCGQETPATFSLEPASEASSEGRVQGWVEGTGHPGPAGYRQTSSQVLAYLIGEHCQVLMEKGPGEGVKSGARPHSSWGYLPPPIPPSHPLCLCLLVCLL